MKVHYSNTPKESLLLLFLAILCLFVTGCIFEPGAIFIRERHPKVEADFDGCYYTDFQVGDRFELLKDMYLFDGFVASTWELNRSDWNQAARPLLRIVRAGETIEISALKLSAYQRTLFVYFKLESGEDWVCCYLFDWPDRGHYDRTWFKKLTEQSSRGQEESPGTVP